MDYDDSVVEGIEDDSWFKQKLENTKENPQPSKERLRRLKQYKDMSDEEFDKMYDEKLSNIQKNRAFERVIQRKIDELSKDYDIDDLNSNDKLTLRALAQAMISLESLEIESFNKRSEGLTIANINITDRIHNMASTLRADISKMQIDLNISRRVRKNDTNSSVKDQFEIIKQKAKEFYMQKMSYVICPKCDQLLATIWTLFPLEERNKLTLVCGRTLEDGSTCGHKFTVSTKELIEKRGTNSDNLPESMR